MWMMSLGFLRRASVLIRPKGAIVPTSLLTSITLRSTVSSSTASAQPGVQLLGIRGHKYHLPAPPFQLLGALHTEECSKAVVTIFSRPGIGPRNSKERQLSPSRGENSALGAQAAANSRRAPVLKFRLWPLWCRRTGSQHWVIISSTFCHPAVTPGGGAVIQIYVQTGSPN
ncbi:MAG: hypothetical protein ACLRVT_05795 [Oscillospiraceae bacterium]